jgi:hypothetical protein
LTKLFQGAILILAYGEGEDIINYLVVKPDGKVWWQNRQTFFFAFRNLTTEYQRVLIPSLKQVKRERAYGGCLGIKGRRRAWQDCEKPR